ncbi:hypothetical protein RSal33209_3386 [Renibacterium salmoninarum ATCC 33209]|uniref:Uncharacterized protein n=1 Tax=Renibacterium salmoninarum (strain ATCC 33209 / DSM 20767 / JCM 11484 / NBRC 15589 / NCIMB 2235) TaxID=288705 RepID=A9WV75_RENSM|nr:hypothetical protein RSal33209_3386 [Renibacterium salmoninarum ATCC 33209]
MKSTLVIRVSALPVKAALVCWNTGLFGGISAAFCGMPGSGPYITRSTLSVESEPSFEPPRPGMPVTEMRSATEAPGAILWAESSVSILGCHGLSVVSAATPNRDCHGLT